MKRVTILRGDPVVAPLAEPRLLETGIEALYHWLESRRPECRVTFPASGTGPCDLIEMAGRKCYNSFGARASKRTGRDYVQHLLNVGHKSVFYHVHFSFFVAGISRRLLQELIRHHVGTDADVEGSPSVESTRFVEFNGFYVAHPKDLDDGTELEVFEHDCEDNFRSYQSYVKYSLQQFKLMNTGAEPLGLKRKRIYEAASQRLSGAAETSLVWTSNSIALMKMFEERSAEAVDLEFQRLVRVWQEVCRSQWPEVFDV